MDWMFVAAVVLSPAAAFAGQAMLKTYVEKIVTNRFEQKIEGFRSELRIKEDRLNALQGKLLGDRAALNAHILERRLEALEAIWEAAGKLDRFIIPVMAIRILNLDEIAKKSSIGENERRFFEQLGGTDRTEEIAACGGSGPRLYVPDQIWKVFSAYKGLYVFCYMRLRVLAIGLNQEQFFQVDGVIDPIKEVLPHFSAYLDKHGVSGAAHLIDPLRELLFSSLRTCLTSTDAEEQDMTAVIGAISRLDQYLGSQT